MAAVAIPTAGESLGAWLDAAIDAVVAVAIDSLEEPAIRAELVADERRIRRLQARTTNLAAALAERQAARQLAARTGRQPLFSSARITTGAATGACRPTGGRAVKQPSAFSTPAAAWGERVSQPCGIMPSEHQCGSVGRR